MANQYLVDSPYSPFTIKNQFKAISNGKVYIGEVDKDPLNPSQQIQVYVVDETGSNMPVSQPIQLNAGGYLVYNGQVSKFITLEPYSMVALNNVDSEMWRVDDISKVDPDNITASNVRDTANGGSVQDFIDSQYTTVAELATGKFGVGTYVRLTDRAGALFYVVAGGIADGYGTLNAGIDKTAKLARKNGLVFDTDFGVVPVFDLVSLLAAPDSTPAHQAFFDYCRINRVNGKMVAGATAHDGTIYYDPDSFQQSTVILGSGYDPLITTPELSNGTILYKRNAGDLFRLNCVLGSTNKRETNGIQHLQWGNFTIMGKPEVTAGVGNGVTGIFSRTIRASDFNNISFYQVDRMVEANDVNDYCDYNRFERIRHRDIYRSGIRIRQNDDGIIDLLTNNVNTWNPQDSDDCMARCYGSFRQKVKFVVGNPPTAATSYLFSRYAAFSDAHAPIVEAHNELVDWKVMGVFFSNTTDAVLKGYWRDSTIGVSNVNSLTIDNLTCERVTSAQKLIQIFDTAAGTPSVEPYVYISSSAHRIAFGDTEQNDVGFDFNKANPLWGVVKRGQVWLENSSIRKNSDGDVWVKSLHQAVSNNAIVGGATTIATISLPNVSGGGCVDVDVITIGPTAQTVRRHSVTFLWSRASGASATDNTTIVIDSTLGVHAITITVTKSVILPTGTEVYSIVANNSGGQTYRSIVNEASTVGAGTSIAFIS